MVKNKSFLIALLPVLFFILNCSSTQYVDSRKDTGSRQWGAKEINETVDKMVASLYAYLRNKNGDVLLAVDRIRNRTSEHIDTKLIGNEISTRLIQRGIPFIDKSQRESSIEEIEFGQTGLGDSESAITAGHLKSPNYHLTGDITDSVSYEGNIKKQFIVVTLKLVEIESTMVLWQERQEFMKHSKQEKYSW